LELKPLISELLSRKAIERRGVFRPEAIEELLKDHAEGKRDNALKIWALLMLEVWYRMYIDGQAGLFAETLQAAMLSENPA